MSIQQLPMEFRKTAGGMCRKCLWFWETSIITKDPEDNGIYTCYNEQSARFHEEACGKGCGKYENKARKIGTKGW